MDPHRITRLQDVTAALAIVHDSELRLDTSLTQLLDDHAPVATSLQSLTQLLHVLDDTYAHSVTLSANVSATALTAQRVGGRVRSLDEQMKRLREAAERVAQVIELKSSFASLHAAIDAQDWEGAARHCARAMSLPKGVLSGPFAEAAVPTAESHLPPVQTLQSAREQLLAVFRRNFEQASQSRNSADTSRFFKLFPAIGWEDEGLDAYASFVVDLVRVRPPASAKTSSSLYYITALTALFESIALIIDQHQPVVEKYYGSGKMIPVIRRLLLECDKAVGNLLDSWTTERSLKRAITEVLSSPPANVLSTTSRHAVETNSIDPRDIDKLLVEITGMVSRWSIFVRFLSDSLQSENGDSESLNVAYHIIESTGSFRAFENTLSSYYVPLEIWYLRTIIDKAHRLSTADLSQNTTMTTTPDDVFYVLKVVMHRLLSLGSLSTVARVLEQIRDILERDYINVIRRKMDDVYRGSNSAAVNTRSDKTERENRITFMTLLNDLDVSSSHLDRLVRDLNSSSILAEHFSTENQAVIKDHLSTFGLVGSRVRTALRVGVEQLFNQLVRPKLRTFVVEVYRDISYVLDEAAYQSSGYQDIVRKRFARSWDNLMDLYHDTFTETNYRLFYSLALDAILRPWEKHLLSMKFTELGAMRFDRDLRSVTGYLSSQLAFGDVREKIIRLQQISTILNIDNEEDVDEFYNGSGIAWKLSIQEARSIIALKISL